MTLPRRVLRFALFVAITGSVGFAVGEYLAKMATASPTEGGSATLSATTTAPSTAAPASPRKSKSANSKAPKVQASAANQEPATAAPPNSSSQEENAPESEGKLKEVEHESPEMARLRAEYFQHQRAYPFKHVPAGALQKALAQRDAMKAAQKQQNASGVQADAVITFPGNGLWQLTGPQPVDFPFGPGTNEGNPTASGRITAIAVDPTNANIVYVGGAAGGVWKSTNALAASGVTWTPLTDNQPSLAVGSIAIDPNSCSPGPCTTIYVGTGESNFNGDAFYGAGILKSTDGGSTWTQLGASSFVGPFAPDVGGAQIGAIAVQPGNSNVVLAAAYFFDGPDTNGGIWISSDGGTTWGRPSGATGSAGTAVVFDPGTPTNVYAALGDAYGATNNGVSINGIYKSTDSGATWTLLAGGLPTTSVGRITLGYAASTTGSTATIYAAIADSSTSSSDLLGLYKTTTGGSSWTELTAPTGTGGGFCAGQCYYDMAIGVDPANANVVVIGGGPYSDNFTSLFESTNGGTSWTTGGSGPVAGNFANGATSVNVHVDTHAIVFTPTGSSLFVGDDGGMWRTDDPQPGAGVSPTWVDLNASLATLQFYPGVTMSQSDDNYGVGGTQDNGTDLFTGNLAWTWLDTCGDGGPTAFDTEYPTTLYVACSPFSSSSPIWKSVFNGQNDSQGNESFNAASSGIPGPSTERSLFIPPMTLDKNTPTNLYYGTCRVWQTVNSASTWSPITNDLTTGNTTASCAVNGGDSITTIDVDGNNPDLVLAGTSNGTVWATQNALSGSLSTWSEVDNGLLPGRYVTTVRNDKTDATGQTAYVSFSGFGSCSTCDGKGHIFKTTNLGTAWTDISGDLPDAPINDVLLDVNNGAVLAVYIGTDVGVFACYNPGASPACANWTVVGDGLPNSPVLALAGRQSQILQAATHGRSMWNIQLTDEQPGSKASLASMTPAAVMVGAATTSVTVTGVNFSTNTLVLFNGVSVGTPTFVNTTQLTISVNSSLFTNGQVYAVTVSDPQGASTKSLPFTVMNPILAATTMSPSTTTTYTPVTLTFTGSSFVSGTFGTVVTFNGVQLVGGSVTGGGTGFTVPVPVSLLTSTGTVPVTITNPLPGGGPTPATSFSFTITANAGPTAVVSPSPIILGPINLGTTTSPATNVSITNYGTTNSLNITAQSITGTNAANFSFAAPTSGTSCNFPTSGQSGTGTVTLAANGGTCNFGITYTAGTPPGAAVSVATLNITDNAQGSPQATPVEGVPNISIVEITPVSFGGVPIGTTSATMNATLVNSTSSTLMVSATGITISGTNAADFHLVAAAAGGNTPCTAFASFSVNPESLCDVGVTFTPSISGNESATISVSDNGPGSPQSASLTGVGIEVTSISPQIVASGGPAFTLTVNGGGFASGAVVNVNGSARLTTFVSSTQLLASIPASDIATAGSLAITVTSPSPGGTTSEPKTLFVAQAEPATNDNINFVYTVSATPFRITEDTTQATENTGGVNDPPTSCGSNSIARSVWFKFVAPSAGRVIADTRQSSYTTILSAWTGTPGSLTLVSGACANGNVPASSPFPAESLIGFSVTSGTTYYLMVTDQSTTGAGGTLTFSLDFASAAPANDAFSAATTIGSAPFSTTENTILATANTGGAADPVPSCASGTSGLAGTGVDNSVWFSYTPSSNGTITADTLTSPYETILTAVTGTTGSFTQVACNVSAGSGIAQSQVSFAATSGTKYYFMVSSVLGDGGTTNFHLTFSTSTSNPVPTITSFSPTSATAGGAAFTLTINGTNFVSGATGTFNGNARTVTFVSATQVTMAVTAADIAAAGSFPVVVTNPAPGGGASTPVNFPVNNPLPTTTSISPTSATAGGAAFTLTVNGTNFSASSVVNFNGTAQTTTFVSATQVTAAITAAEIAAAGTPNVTVTNPAPGGGTSNAQTFTINNPTPTISSLSPTGATAGGAAFTLTVNGTGFVSTSSVKFNGNARTTTFVSSTQVTAAITAADIATAGTYPVTVTNPAPGGGTSNSVNFNVSAANNPVPTLTSISPTTATAGGAAFTLTLTGTNFIASSVANFNGAAQATTFVSSTQLTAAITAADIATGGIVPVTVTNPAPGGGTTSSQNFTIQNPAANPTSLSPSSANAGGAAFTLTINGTNFVNGATGTFNGNARTVTFVSSTQVTMAVTAADIATAGSFPVVVSNPAPAGGSTGALTFTVNNLAPTLTSISPTSATAGGTAFTLTLNGTNFVSNSTVKFGTVSPTTTFVSSTQLTAAITAADIATAGTYAVTVTDPTPGGGTTSAINFTVNNPVPSISSLSPSSATAGGAAFTLTINGSNFISGATGTFNGNARTVTFVSATQVTMAVTAADIATAGIFPVVVSNPSPGGGASAPANFTVNNPAPTITSLSPNSATAGGAAFTLTVNGTGFVSASSVNFNGNARTTTFVSATQITAAITAADIATAGTLPVTVTNPTPGGGTSASSTFTVNNPAPAITSLSPTGVTAGGAPFTLTVNGTNFVSTSVVNFNGTAVTTTFVSSTKITAAITAAEIATAANVNVTVTNPTPGGGTSTAVLFDISSAPNPVPTLSSISPTSVTAGGAAFTLTVNGTNYVSSSVVNFNGSARTTTVVSATQLTAAITAADIATAGSYPITVFNPAPGGGTSSAVNLAVNNPVPTISTLSPSSAIVGGAAFTLTISGSNFVNAATGTFNGNARTVTFVSSTQVTMAVAATDIATVGSFPVVITNPAPGGGASGAVNFAVTNPLPTISSLSPASATAGGAAFTLTVNGTNFVSTSVVNFNGNGKTTTFVSSTQVTAAITAADIATAGTVNVTVTNPAPGGGTSGNATFTINNPAPTLTSIAPTSGLLNQSVNLVLTGSSFVAGSVVNFGSNADSGGAVSNGGTTLTITIPAAQLSTAGTVNVTVTNPAPGGGTTAAQTFTVNNPVPTLTSISPTSGTLGQSVNLALTGTNFVTGSVVNFGANADSGGVVSNGGTTLTITIPATQLAAAGPVNVTVTNPTPGGGTTSAQTFTVNNPAPTLTSVAPTTGVVGQSANLTLTGTNFVTGAVVNFGANADSGGVVSNNGTTLTITIPAAQLATAGTVNISVKNPTPGGGTSAAVQFTVQNAQPVVASLSPANATAGGATFTLTISGSNFVNGATVNFGSTSGLQPASTTATQIQVSIPAAAIATAGTYNVVVTNPAPAVGPSLVQTFTVLNPVPTISSATSGGQNHAAGGAAFTLTVNGTNFVSGTNEASVVNFNGKAETTTYVSSTQITASIPASDVSTAGNFNVTVTNPSPGGGTTATSITFTIDGYTVTGPANPVTVKAGQTASIPITIKPTSNGFANPVTVNVTGLPAHTTFTPVTVTPGNTQVTVTLSITTKAGVPPPPSSRVRPPSPPVVRLLFGSWLVALLLGLYAAVLVRRTPRLRRYAAVVPLTLVLLTGAVLGGCAGMSGTPHGNSTLTITATSGTLSQTTSAVLTVN